MGQHPRGSRDLKLRLSPAHACCWAVQRVPNWARSKCKVSFPVQESCLLQGFSPERICWTSAALCPGSGTCFARFLLSVVRNSFSFLSLSEGQNCACLEAVPSSQGHGHWLPKFGNNRIANVHTKNYSCQWLRCIRCNSKELKINMTNSGSQQPWLPLC